MLFLKSSVITFLVILTTRMATSAKLTPPVWAQILKKPFRLRNPTFLTFNSYKAAFMSRLLKYAQLSELGSLTAVQWNQQNMSRIPANVRFNPLVCQVETLSELKTALEMIDKYDSGTKNIVYLIVPNDSFVQLVTNIRLNQQIFTLDLKTLEVAESYRVNYNTLRNPIGNYIIKLNGEVDFRFHDFDNWSLHVGKRRSNLHGEHITIVTSHDPPYTAFRDGYLTAAPFLQDTQAYDVTDWTFGIYHEILQTLADEANFTFSIIARKEGGGFGTVENGTKTSNTLNNIVDGSADMIVGALGITENRKLVLDYLPIISSNWPSIFIRNSPVEDFHLTTITKPFATDVWISCIVVVVIYATWLFLGNHQISDGIVKKLNDYLGWIWFAFSANVGGNSKKPLSRKTTSNKLVMVFCLIGGTVVWINYRASITSELSAVTIEYPFDSLEGVLETDFTVATDTVGSAPAELFITAKEGSLYHKIFKNHMQSKDSFVDADIGLQNVLDKYKYAYIEDKFLIQSFVEFNCKILAMVDLKHPLYSYSFGLSKTSPYKESLSWSILKMRETGKIQEVLSEYFRDDKKQCKSLLLQTTPLSIKKMLPLFLIVAGGVLLGGILITIEILVSRSNDSNKEHLEEEAFDPFDDKVQESLRYLKERFHRSPDRVKEAYGQLTFKDLLEITDFAKPHQNGKI